MLASAPIGLFETDAHGDCVFVNERWCAFAGLTPDEALGSGWARAIHPDDRDRVASAWAEAVAEGRDTEMEFRAQRPDGSVTWLAGTATRLIDTDDRLTPAEMRQLVDADSISMVGVPLVRDEDVLGALALGRVTERELAFSALECEVLELLAGQTALALANAQLLDEVSQLAIRDELTGLFNRRHFSATFDHLLQRRARERGPKPSVVAVMFDLDYFGHFNKEHGHQAGDAVLRTFAAILRGRFRASDLLARYGGEEFVVILEDATLEDATRIADEIRRELETSAIEGPEGTALRATVSAGCARLTDEEPTREALLRAADVGLFMAKRAGRNQVVAA